MTNVSIQFQSLVEELFRRQPEFSVESNKMIAGREADLLLTTPVGVAVVEVKFYRSRQVDVTTLRNVVARLEQLRRVANADKAILVTTARVNAHSLSELKAVPNLVIYDFDTLTSLLAGFPDLSSRLDNILMASNPFGSSADDRISGAANVEMGFTELGASREGAAQDASILEKTILAKTEPEGEGLRKKLRQLLVAQATATAVELRSVLAKEFERVCTDALKYLFADDLTAWNTQHSSYDRVSRFDLIARLRPTGDFWRQLVTDFGARYVVFEFKFYRDKIGQGEILTTEKYLYIGARRTVAIIISPQGADDNALRMAGGALREHGKLLLNLTIEQICNMLLAKDGEEVSDGTPADVEQELFETLDDMLMGIER